MDKKKQAAKPLAKQQQPNAKSAMTRTPGKSCMKAPSSPKPLARVPSAPGGTNLPEDSSPAPNCQKRFEHLIHKHQIKNEELERREDHLLHRLEMLQCSMPVMLAQVCQKPDGLLQLLERQFSDEDENACRITPSRHYDCRVREIEAQRKEAYRRKEEARVLWQEREAALQNQMERLELARQEQQRRKQRVEQLATETRKLQQQSNAAGEKEWLSGSEVSLGSEDLQCLRQLEALLGAESCKRRHVTELEAQNEMYMRVLARAEEIHPADKVNRQQELYKQLEACRTELARYRDVEKSEAGCGSTAPETSHKDAQVVPRCVSRKSSARIKSPKPASNEQACEALVQAQSKITWAGVETSSKEAEARVECAAVCVGRLHSEANKSVLVRPEACDKKSQAKAKVASLALGADVSQLEQPSKCECGVNSEQSDKQFGTCCPTDSNATRGLSKKASLQKLSAAAVSEKGLLKIPRSEIETCMSIVNDMYEKLAGSAKFPHVCKDFQNLKNIFASSLGLDINILEKQADRSGKESKKQEVCDGASFAKDEKKQQIANSTTALACIPACSKNLAQRCASIGKIREKSPEKVDSMALKCKQVKEKQKCSDSALSRKRSERGWKPDNAALTCKCEPQQQKHHATVGLPSKIEKRPEKCDRAVSTDRQESTKLQDDPSVKTCKEPRVKLKVDETARREKEQKRVRQDDTEASASRDEKRKQAACVPTPKSELLQEKNDASAQLSNIDKQKCGGNILSAKEEKRRHKDDVEASTCKGEKRKTKDVDCAQQCKEEKKKCNDIVAALSSKCEKEKQMYRVAAPAVKCKPGKYKDDPSRLGKSADATSTCKEDKKKQKDDPIVKGPKDKLKESDSALATKKDKMKTKLADTTSACKADKEKSKHADSVKAKKDDSCKKDQKPSTVENNETISKTKRLCCEKKDSATRALTSSKIEQKSPRDCDSKQKLGSASTQPCGSEKKLSRNCEIKKCVKAAQKLKGNPCRKQEKESEAVQTRMNVSSVPDDEEKTSQKSLEEQQVEETSPSENVVDLCKHESADKQPCEERSLKTGSAESEYFKCSCDFLPCLIGGGVQALYTSQTKDKSCGDKTPFEQLCICEPSDNIADKWRREAAAGKLYCGYRRDKRAAANRRQARGRRARPRARQRHHPYKRPATSSTCLGRPRLSAKCTCSGLLASSPSVCALPEEPCRRCGVRISSWQTRLCAALLTQTEQQVISQRNQSDIACSELRSCGKRDQGVLAKLPKPAKRKKRNQTECPLEGSQAVPSFQMHMLPRRDVGPSCTCLTNLCYCPTA